MPGWSQNPFWSEDPEELEQAGLSTASSPSMLAQTTAAEKKKVLAKKKTSAAVPRKRKSTADSVASPKNPKPSKSSAVDIFASDTEAEDDNIISCAQSDEREVQFASLKPMRAATLKTFLSQRGSSGYTFQRDPVRSGEYYIELRVYNTQEAEQTPCDERWRKALLTLKTCADTDSAIWKSVSELVKEAKQDFKKIQPIMYPNDQ